MDILVTTEWLAGEIGASDLRIVDASWHLDPARDAAGEYEAGHIPGAVFMDLAELSDKGSDLPMTLPSAEKFASRMATLGLGDGSRVVIYDDSDVHSAARAWWMLRLYGAHNVAILDGGLKKWKAEGRALAAGKETLRHRHFTAWRDEAQVRTLAQMQANMASKVEQVIDARPPNRFAGDDPEPRPGVTPGHIPGSVNLPAGSLFAADNRFKSIDELRAAFAAAGVDPAQPMAMTCGSGVTAAILAFAAERIGGKQVTLYDGSWAEWGSHPDTSKAQGPA